MQPQNEYFAAKSVLVTGVCGTIGRELFRLLTSQYGVKHITGLDQNESRLFLLEQEYAGKKGLTFSLADIRDVDSLAGLFHGVDIVFHTAAYKHVILCERSPMEAIQTNILGVRNVIKAAKQARVGQVLFTSSDKAVNPTNVMGASKLMGERLMTAANTEDTDTLFFSTRFGNVLGSRGSVVPVFTSQIRRGGPVTLTDPEMTRFVMGLSDATRLVIDSCMLARGGEIFVPKMPALAIKDLAAAMIESLAPAFGLEPAAIEVKTIGAKPGEKLYEELISPGEIRRTVELERYYAVLPALRDMYRPVTYAYESEIADSVDQVYISSMTELMGRDEIKDFLAANAILDCREQ